MKVFISWSGEPGKALAFAVNGWAQSVIQAIKPVFSPEIPKGEAFRAAIESGIQSVDGVIVCVTHESLESTWVAYEVGAIRSRGKMVWPIIADGVPKRADAPLGDLQGTAMTKEDMWRLALALNGQLPSAGGESLAVPLLRDAFEKAWPDLEARFPEIRALQRAAGGARRAAVRDLSDEDRSAVIRLSHSAQPYLATALRYHWRYMLDGRRLGRVLFSLFVSGTAERLKAFLDGTNSLETEHLAFRDVDDWAGVLLDVSRIDGARFADLYERALSAGVEPFVVRGDGRLETQDTLVRYLKGELGAPPDHLVGTLPGIRP